MEPQGTFCVCVCVRFFHGLRASAVRPRPGALKMAPGSPGAAGRGGRGWISPERASERASERAAGKGAGRRGGTKAPALWEAGGQSPIAGSRSRRRGRVSSTPVMLHLQRCIRLCRAPQHGLQGHGRAAAGADGGHRDLARPGAPLLQGKAETAGLVQPAKET